MEQQQSAKRQKRSNVAYVKGLEDEIKRLKSQSTPSISPRERDTTSTDVPPASTTPPPEASEVQAGSENDIANPLFESAVTSNPDGVHTQATFIGESACTAFGERLLNCIDPEHKARDVEIQSCHFRHPALLRSSEPKLELPNRIQASLLVRRAMKFIGTDYHLMLRKSFFEKLERAYNHQHPPDRVWTCSLFVMLALGELYSNCRSDAAETRVPGTGFFLQAMSLLEDNFQDASLDHVQALILISFYSNALGRTRSSYTYAGIALRMAVGLGLHRSQKRYYGLSAVEREDRRRVFWTVYLFDRLSSSRLGYPATIHDDDIDVELPSMEGLSKAEMEEFAEPAHLCANIRLGQISGKIMSVIYCLPRRNKGTFVHRVHTILKSLRAWDDQLPPQLRRWNDSSPRNVFSLHLSYNQCIIETTRPILLHIFKLKHNLHNQSQATHTSTTFSPTTLALAESCVQAACTSNSILSKLFVEGNLAMFGYFDALYLFSSTLILIVSAILEPDATMSDAVQTAFHLLRSMAETGNLPAGEYYQRLRRIRMAIESLRSRSETRPAMQRTGDVPANVPAEDDASFLAAEIDQSSRKRILPERAELDNVFQDAENFRFDALDNPFIDQFLAEGAFGWPDGADIQDQAMRDLMEELGDDFLVGSV